MVGRALRVVGFVGVAVSAAALVPALVLIWLDWSEDFDWATWLQALGVLTTVAVSLAQANLLLLLAERRAPVVRIGLILTVSCIAIVAVLISIPILTSGEARFSRDEPDATSRISTSEQATLALAVTPDIVARLDALAAETGSTREQAAVALLSARAE